VRNPAFIQLLREIEALHDSKSADYAGEDPMSNLRMCEAMGIPAWKGVLVRLTDKWSRLQQLSSGKTPKHESMRDSLMDNAVYSLLCINLIDEATNAASTPAQTTKATTDLDFLEPVPPFGWTVKDDHKMPGGGR
jgi:hypothetical protein